MKLLDRRGTPADEMNACLKASPLWSKVEKLHLTNYAELQQEVTNWLKTQAAEMYEEGIVKLIHRYDKCLNLKGDYVEK
ncbi:hypothetical protein J6590_048909 [Homalodisca vitripennis]|nr:hypothetical protein J6590_048909 [Homalodisca vitripennis]